MKGNHLKSTEVVTNDDSVSSAYFGSALNRTDGQKVYLSHRKNLRVFFFLFFLSSSHCEHALDGSAMTIFNLTDSITAGLFIEDAIVMVTFSRTLMDY